MSVIFKNKTKMSPPDFSPAVRGCTPGLSQLPIAFSKCCVFNIGSKIPQPTPCIIDSGSMPSVEEVVDLGVTLHKSLKFSSHVSTICCKAHRRANLILKCFYSKDASSLLSAFITYVRPILE